MAHVFLELVEAIILNFLALLAFQELAIMLEVVIYKFQTFPRHQKFQKSPRLQRCQTCPKSPSSLREV
jgi:hypothetical protein